MIISTVPLNEEVIRHVLERTGEQITVCPDLAALPAEVLPQVDVMVARNETFKPELLEMLSGLRFLYIMSAGVDNLPFNELIARRITVCNASGIHGQQMSEHALGVMIAFSRNIGLSIRNQSSRLWGGHSSLDELNGKTLLIVGAGRIGKEIGRLASAFGMRITGVTRRAQPIEGFDLVYPISRLHEGLGQADYVILLTPLTSETAGLMGTVEFAAMKPTAVFLNLSRGETVDEPALISALKQGMIAGAGLDVFQQEPLPAENELWAMENVIITPHSAGITRNYIHMSMMHFIKNLLLFRAGGELLSPVDLIEAY
ncbi:D-2-hydroxyacid dehydrogenase [Paenibacillus camerounensis]|uniref:D-2-hydroxyacid dehydrogenase n=1 Tax=Paenibacillus camerounensis TaxID=1243663 RepID=UPI0006945290|nr:D-2-hydroxyacid dehydrogenase [Paenibacillus camerounensis]